MRLDSTTIACWVIVGISLVLGALYIHHHNAQANFCQEQLKQLEYNIEDVTIWFKGTDYSLCDFLNSPSLQKVYEERNFKFVEGARNTKAIKEARDAANVAVGISAANLGMQAVR
jgi:hypothetical protein